jgi:hypothetical protein
MFICKYIEGFERDMLMNIESNHYYVHICMYI